MKAAGLEPALFQAPQWLAWVASRDRPDGPPRPMPRPAPTPPVDIRPRKLSVTEIETWKRDPYAIYARHILKLRPMEPIDAAAEAAERGTIIHEALDAFIRAYPDRLPANASEALLRFGETAFGGWLDRPAVWAFWWPRFERIAAWFLEQREAELPGLLESLTELTGRLEIEAEGFAFTLTAKADRIDRLRDGGTAIIDYKTGALPSAKMVKQGYAPQLPLEAAIAAWGGFPDLGTTIATRLDYWRLSGGEPPGFIEKAGGKDADAVDLAGEALNGLRRLIADFANPGTPYLSQPHPAYAPHYSDYGHLARIAEWSVAGGEE
jgi:ATP-dependent helicase/nuclease subunit B